MSLLITTKESTYSLIFSTPSCACFKRFGPSNPNGTVTIPIVRISNSLQILAITGAAPVPVPPPIPAVTKTILVLDWRIPLISASLSRAAFSPTNGFSPAPNPSVKDIPNCIFVGA